MLQKIATTSVAIDDLIARRWSPRAFDPNRAVSREQLTSLLEAARWAPSCNGDQPWRYLIWDRHRDPDGFQKAYDCINDNNKRWVKNVPLLLLSCAATIFEVKKTPNRWAQYDTGTATGYLALQASALGLVAHQMGGFDADKTRATFAIPADHTPMAMVAVGYQAEPDTITEPDIREKELAPRTRKSLDERFFEGNWGRGIKLP